MAIPMGRPQLQAAQERGVYRILHPDLPGWREVVDDAVRAPQGGTPGPVPALAFSKEPFVEQIGKLSVFSPRRDALLMHLAHPMLRRAMNVLARRRYPGGGAEVSRWAVRCGDMPPGADAVILLSVEELAVNELRETFLRWVRTLALPVRGGVLGAALAPVPARARRSAKSANGSRERAHDIFEEIEPGLRDFVRRHRDALTDSLRRQLKTDGEQARRRENERYQARQGELSSLIERTTVGRLEREIEDLKTRRAQGQLFDETDWLSEIERSIEDRQQEISRRLQHCEDIREQLRRERERIIDRLLPARYALAGEAQVFPVAIEILLPENHP